VGAELQRRAQGESYRLLYVAASRARDVLLLSGSVKDERPEGWAKALTAVGFGPDAKPYARPDFVLQRWPVQAVAPPPEPEPAGPALGAAAWTARTFPPLAYPPVSSPSSLKGDETHEPLPITDPDEGERLPGRARVVGTLVHYAISQNWSAANLQHLENLRAQEVMFPFSAPEQEEIIAEVAELLTSYEGLLGTEIAALGARREDHAELPLALPYGGTVWQGVIDRFYCAGGVWYLEDYKTDREVAPEHYHFQLALYLRALREVRGVTPTVQLVYLRAQRVVRVSSEVLARAFEGTLGPVSRRATR
jgi:ATP-dependent exoDNAse (exonuclease V) beta subunit